MSISGRAPPPLGLYVHLPWCVRKCPYCDFNSYRAASDLPERHYVDALLRDLDAEIELVGDRPLETIFLGGGTPSLFSGASIARLLDGIRTRVACAPDVEITLEANPGASESARFGEFCAAGVTRLSVGVQSFRGEQLRALGRVHDVDQAERAITAAMGAGFAAVNIDIMYGLPGDSFEGGLFDLQAALRFGTQHISWYQLALEPNTAFHRKPPVLPDDEIIAEIEISGRALLNTHGFERYEVSAYARDGGRCRHNLNYWSFGDYIGIGAGAHGKLTMPEGIVRRSKQRNPLTYMEWAGQSRCTDAESVTDSHALVLEFLMNALRLVGGIDIRELEARTGVAAETMTKQIAAARNAGWLVPDERRLRATASGFQQLNRLLLLFC
jgi:oxygen-independent coproporphyrinogen-3 oxidase